MFRSSAFITLLLCSILALPAFGQEPYRLQPGDELDVRVVGIPNLDRRLFIEETGEVALPLIGRVAVAGATVAEAQDDIAAQMSGKVYRQRSLAGEIDLFSIDAQEVTVAIASYLPVYVDGNVGRPGAVDFTPGLTARRAIALAGGAGGTFSEDRDTTPQLLQARGRHRSIRAQLAALDIRLARLRAQAGLEAGPEGMTAGGSRRPTDSADDGRDSSGLDTIEQTLAGAMNSNLDRERAFLEEARAATVNEIALLEEQLSSYGELVSIDEEELQRLLELGERGLVQANQTVAARRSLSSSRTDRLEALSDLADRRRDLVRIDFELEDLSAMAVSDGLEALADGMERRARLQAELEGLQEQILFFGGGVSDLGEDVSVRIEIARGEDRLVVPEGGDMRLRPGDLVDVAVDLFQAN